MQTLAEAYDQLRDENQRALSDRKFGQAYHLLAASMHLAQAYDRVDWLQDISRAAFEQQKIVNKDERGLTESDMLKHRSLETIFESLAKIAKSGSRVARTNQERRAEFP